MNFSQILQNTDWNTFRSVWQMLDTLPVDDHADWDGLRLWLEDQLARLQEPGLDLAPAEQQAMMDLFHLKVDQMLNLASRSRQARHPMYHATNASSGTSIHYKAARLMEQRLDKYFPDLGITDRAKVASDSNTDLVVTLLKAGQEQPHVDLLVTLSVPTSPVDIWDLVGKADRYRLALAGLKSDSSRVLEAALRESMRLKDPGLIPALADRLEGREHHPLAPKIVEVLAEIPDATVIPHLTKLALSDVDDYNQQQDYYYPTRLAAIRALTTHDRPELVVPVLMQILQKEACGIQTQLIAIKYLAELGQPVGLEIALQALDLGVSKNYDEVRDLAAEAIAAIGDPEALPYIKGAVQQALRLNTSLERYGAMLTPQVPAALRHAVEALGGTLDDEL